MKFLDFGGQCMREIAILLLRLVSWLRGHNLPGYNFFNWLQYKLDPPLEGEGYNAAALEFVRRIAKCPKDVFYEGLEFAKLQEERAKMGLSPLPVPEKLKWQPSESFS
ncbi:MAG: hypothetical protein FJ045_04015, partial [Crenarchaeota archaeon]|nr:hypothetical protein [Thermoproteota archaeon]